MDKLGQKRNRYDKFKENWTPGALGGKAMESFSPEFQELMEHLREVDEKVRELAVGEDEGESIKDLLKVAKTNFNRREYMTAISFLGRFHDRLETISNEFSKLKQSVDMKHNEFLFGNLDPEHLEYLKNKLGPKFDKRHKAKAAQILTRTSLEKEAGLADWWHNLRSEPGRTMAAWEKRFPKYARELKSQTNMMLHRSETLLNFVLALLKKMSGLRNARKLEEYIKDAQKIQEKFKAYDVSFLQFYNGQVKHFLAYQAAIEAENAPDTIEEVLKEEMPLGEQAGVLLKPVFDVNKKDNKTPSPKNPNWKPLHISKYQTPEMQALWQLCNKEQRYPTSEEISALPRRDSPDNPLAKSNVPAKAKSADSMEHSALLDKILVGEPPSTPYFPPALKNNITGLEDTMISPGQKKPSSLGDFLPMTAKEPETATHPGSLGNLLPDTKQEPETVDPDSLGNMLPSAPKPKKADHSSFLITLAALEDKHPMMIAKEIMTYAELIEYSDSDMSQRLLTIAANILKG